MTKIKENDLGLSEQDLENIKKLKIKFSDFYREIGKIIIGQQEIIEQILITLLCKGHALIMGVPGLGKTLLVKTISEVLGLNFKRIQFTPDLMPSDIVGTEIIDESSPGKKTMKYLPGPIFANIILADEINRTPPKTQAALLEAMQEYSVTVGGVTRKLDEPFFVLATQNPIEQEGTYPLPEAQLDRFMLMLKIFYPKAEEEKNIYQMAVQTESLKPEIVFSKNELLYLQNLLRKIPVSRPVIDYTYKLVAATRPETDGSGKNGKIKSWIQWGVGPRAGLNLLLGAKALAILDSRLNISIEDIQKIAYPVLRHRIVPNFNAESEGINTDDIIKMLIQDVKEK